MNDKEKQIEQLKQEVNIALARDCSKAKCLTCEFINEDNCEPAIIAESLYNAGYRKIPENAVVLDQEEWKTLHEEYAKALYEKDIQARKETAEKIFSEIVYQIRKRAGLVYHDIEDLSTLNGELVSEVLYEVAIQFGIKIKE